MPSTPAPGTPAKWRIDRDETSREQLDERWIG
jgi:hypothetical protein